MTFEYIRKIPDPAELITLLPVTPDLKKIKLARDEEIKKILTGKSDKFLVIIGPCSAHNEDAVSEYSKLLAHVQEKTKEKLILIPRIYTNKPRTTGIGYKGMMHQPDPQEDPNIVEGIKSIRKMHIRILEETHMSAADEMLYPGNYPYLEDLLSYVAIGARSVENQQHRLTVSGLDIPSGMKNPMSGDLSVMYNAIAAAQHPHVFIYNGFEVNTSGNPVTHGILRGSITKDGRSIPNYHYEDLILIAEQYQKSGLSNPALVIDTNHSNSGKKFKEQPRIALEVLRSRKDSSLIRNMVKGFMIESFIEEGNQKTDGNKFGMSITDPCLGWADSEKLLMTIAEMI